MSAYFAKLSDLFAESTNSGEGGSSRVFHTHLVHQRVDFSWKDAHDGEGGHIQ